jgi:GAF domain-containing protein
MSAASVLVRSSANDKDMGMYPIGPNEEARLALLRSLALGTRERDPGLDHLCRRVADEFEVPIALVSFVDESEQWFGGECGLGARSTPRAVSFCTHALLADEVMVVPDAREDDRFATNPLVLGSPNIVFYAGAPLIYRPKLRIGTLCLIDRRAHRFSAAEASRLAERTDEVTDLIWTRALLLWAI